MKLIVNIKCLAQPNAMQPSGLKELAIHLEDKEKNFDKPFVFTTNAEKNFRLGIKSGTSGIIDWGDNNRTVIDSDLKFNKKTKLAQLFHKYNSAGSYTITIYGNIELDFQCLDVTDIKQWGSIIIKNGHKLFKDCPHLVITALDSPKLQTTDLSYMFAYCTRLDRPQLNWDVSHITNMKNMFRGCTMFNGDLSKWNTSSVTDMSNMFGECSNFNGDLSRWDTSRVIDMNGMFVACFKFNGDLSRWDTSRVIDMSCIFRACYVFNGDLSRWDTGRVMDMRGMFANCYTFNQDLNWNIKNVKDMVSMFWGCTSLTKKQDWDTDADIFDMYRNCKFD